MRTRSVLPRLWAGRPSPLSTPYWVQQQHTSIAQKYYSCHRYRMTERSLAPRTTTRASPCSTLLGGGEPGLELRWQMA
jgi:hypothetical protein